MATDTLFKAFPVGAGGFVCGYSADDTGTTRIIRTDGNAHTWTGDRWLLNNGARTIPSSYVTLNTGAGVEGSCVAPGDPLRAYMIFRGAVMKSVDGAHSWTATSLAGQVTAANDDFRTHGPRMRVDPGNSEVVYFGSRTNGLYYTRDGGVIWTQVPLSGAGSVPAGLAWDLADNVGNGFSRQTFRGSDGVSYSQGGVLCVTIDRSSSVTTAGGGVSRRSTVYAAPYGQGVYRSTNGGTAWTSITPSTDPTVNPLGVTALRVAADGIVYVASATDPAFKGASTNDVWKWDPTGAVWTKITPGSPTRRWTLACDPNNAGRVFMVAAGGDMRLTEDRGSTWTRPTAPSGSPADATGDVPWLAWAATNADGSLGYMSVGEIHFDPIVPGRVWICEGTGVWWIDLSVSTTTLQWHCRSRGIEQLVGQSVSVPGSGRRPLFGGWDRNVFRSPSDTAYAATYGPTRDFGTAWTVDTSPSDPDYSVANICSHNDVLDIVRTSVTTDNGVTWTPLPTLPPPCYGTTDPPVASAQRFGYGAIAVGAPGVMIWVSANGTGAKHPWRTGDGGATWTQIDLPTVTDYANLHPRAKEIYRIPVAFDQVDPEIAYMYHASSGTFRSIDAGITWTKVSSYLNPADDWTWNLTLKAAPSVVGLLYMSTGPLSGRTNQPFVRSTDGGTTWTTLTKITGVAAFGLGKPMPGSTDDTLYAAGYVNGIYGMYRSSDRGANWTWLDDYPTGVSATPKSIDGDPDVAGRVFTTTGTTGYAVGELITTPTEPTPGKVLGVWLGSKQIALPMDALADALVDKADLDLDGRVPMAQLPDGVKPNGVTVASQAAMLALTGSQVQRGDLVFRSDGAGTLMLLGDGDPSILANWKLLPNGPISGALADPGGGVVGDFLKLSATSPSRTFALETLTSVTLDSSGHIDASKLRQSQRQVELLRRSGVKAETCPRVGHQNNIASATTNGKLTLVACVLLKDTVVTGMNWLAGTTAGAGLTHVWAALLDSSYASLRVSADDTSGSWTASNQKAFTLTSSYAVPADAIYYLALAIVGTTAPSLGGTAGLSAGRMLDAPVICGQTATVSGLGDPSTIPTTSTPTTGVAGIPHVEVI